MKTVINACHEMDNEEVLNANHLDYPLFEAILYGDKILTAKLSKRLSCAIKHLPLRIKFRYEYDTQKAIDAGVSKDPSLLINGEIVIEGLVNSEEITQLFKQKYVAI